MNKYLSEAIDAYPYNLPQTIESLGYALSYDDQCPHTLSLYGKVYAEQLKDYPRAISYFEQALQCDLEAVQVYPPYIQALIQYGQFDAAQKVICFALSLKGMDLCSIYLLKSQCFEYQQQYAKALKALKKCEEHIYRIDLKHFILETRARIEAKNSLKKTKKKKKQK